MLNQAVSLGHVVVFITPFAAASSARSLKQLQNKLSSNDLKNGLTSKQISARKRRMS